MTQGSEKIVYWKYLTEYFAMKTEKAETKTVTGSGIFINSSLRLKSNKKPGRKSSFLSASVLLDNVLKTTQKTKLTLEEGVNGSTTVLISL